MYFRFPIMLLLVASLIVGVIILRSDISTVDRPTMESPMEVPPTSTDLREVEPSDLIREKDLKAHVEFLSDDLLKGRDTGSQGSKIAALYIATRFQRLGLQPLGDGSSYFQNISFGEVAAGTASTVAIEVDGEMIDLRYGEDFFVSGFPWDSGTTISGPLIFTGFGIEAPEYDYNDFENIDVENHITVFMSGEPKDGTSSFFNGDEISTQHAQAASKRDLARRKGAVASIGIVHPDILERTNWEKIGSFYDKRDVRLREEALAHPSIVLHPRVGELLFSGTSKTFESICTEADSSRLSSFEMGKSARMNIHFQERSFEDRNVVAELPGSDPVLSDEAIVFSAHYDHIGIGKAVGQDSIYNGAIDNASGVSALLELAEAFSAVTPLPARSVLFVAFTAEEKGLLGSRYYCRHPAFPLGNTIGVINIDMTGMGDSTGIVVYGEEKSSLGETLERAAGKVGLQIIPDELPEERIFYRSDHYNFAREGIPAVLTGLGLRRDNLNEYQTYYHQPTDDASLPINYGYMRRHTLALLAAGLELANAGDRPYQRE